MKFIIIDGYGFVFRAFHSLPPLTRPDGAPIGAVYGFVNMLYKFIEKHEADYIVVALDAGKKTFRHAIYEKYKANRPPAPPELVSQFPLIREAIEAFGIKAVEKEGIEADDLIASYAKYGLNEGVDVTIVSGDKDLLQLIQPGISIYDPMRNKVITKEVVLEKFGVPPSHVGDYLSLLGDSSDNIPGVAGIGAKTAAILLQEYDSLEDIYRNIEKIKPERRQNLLKEGEVFAFLSRKLISLKDDIEPEYQLDKLITPKLHDGLLLEFFVKQGFKSLVSKLNKTKTSEHNQLDIATLTNLKELEKLNPLIIKSEALALYYNPEALYLSFANKEYKIVFTESDNNLFTNHELLTFGNCIEILKDILNEPGVHKICYNSKDLHKHMLKIGSSLNNSDDIATMTYCLETGRNDYSLDSVLHFSGCADNHHYASAILSAYYNLLTKLQQNNLISLYKTVDQPLNKILAFIEHHGMLLDKDILKNLSNKFESRLRELEKEIYHEAGKEFNIASPKKLGTILFEEMQLPLAKKSKSGSFSTGVEVLEELEESGYSIAGKILEWRQFAKLINTYTESLPKFIDKNTNRVHTYFNPTLTSTGRLSSQNPNLQNIPTRSSEGNKIREAFIAPPNYVILSADYSQIELRLLAHIADVRTLKDAFLSGKDIHKTTASQIFGIEEAQITPELRRKAKAINFGIIYGISSFGLARNIGVNKEAAKQYIDRYFQQYPGIKQYMDETINFAREHGYVKTLLGRRCLVPNINNKNYNIRSFAERAAINAPLQGTNADIIKKAMVLLDDELKSYLCMQIHDELLFEIPENKSTELGNIIKETMEQAIKISIPLPVDIRVAKSWARAH